MPGFGLTERTHRLQAYTLKSNGDIGRALCAQRSSNNSSSKLSEPASAHAGEGQQHGEPVVLVGHSLGGAGVARSFAENQQNVAAIVLVAPAIMVSPFNVAVELKERSMMCVPLRHPVWHINLSASHILSLRSPFHFMMHTLLLHVSMKVPCSVVQLLGVSEGWRWLQNALPIANDRSALQRSTTPLLDGTMPHAPSSHRKLRFAWQIGVVMNSSPVACAGTQHST